MKQATRHGVFSLLFRSVVSIHNHSHDTAFNRIVSKIVYELLRSYLFVQSSQWHTIPSKQFMLYEQAAAGPEKEDGLENVIYLLQLVLERLLVQAARLTVTLTCDRLEEDEGGTGIFSPARRTARAMSTVKRTP